MRYRVIALTGSIAALVLLVGIVLIAASQDRVTVGGVQASQAANIGERLANGNMEEGFMPFGVALGWNSFSAGNAAVGFYDDTWSPVVYDGAHSQLIGIDSFRTPFPTTPSPTRTSTRTRTPTATNTPTPTATNTATATHAATNTPTATPTSMPTVTHTPTASATAIRNVFVIVMENRDWSNIVGNTGSAPYINSLLSRPDVAYARNYRNVLPSEVAGGYLHPSEPNYIWMEAGTNRLPDRAFTTNDPPSASNSSSSAAHLVTYLNNAGISWKAYAENISGTACPTMDSYPYAVRHNPFVFFRDVTNDPAYCVSHVRPFAELATDLANNTAARYNFIVPNVCNDMHDASGCAGATGNAILNGDNWLKTNLPIILGSSAYKHGGAVFITWDEDAGDTTNNPIGMIVLSPFAKGNGYSNTIAYSHSSLVKTLQEIFGVFPFLANVGSATDLSDLVTIPIPALTPTRAATAAPTFSPTATRTTTPTTPTATGTPTRTVMPAPAPTAARLLITQVLYEGTQPDEGDEFIEVYNPNAFAVDLSAFKIGDEATRGGSEGMYQFPPGTLFAPNEIIIVARNIAQFRARFPNAASRVLDLTNLAKYTVWATGSLALANSGDEVLLLGPNDELVDSVAWGNGNYAAVGLRGHARAPQPQSLRRYGTQDTNQMTFDFMRDTPRPGALVPLPAPPAPSAGAPMPNGMFAFRGDLHAHSTASDGSGPPRMAFATARANGLNFFALTDHDDDLTAEEWNEMGNAANAANVDGAFVALRGFEYSSAQGHINVYNTDTFISHNDPAYSALSKFYPWLVNQAGAFAQFNHPEAARGGDFNGLAFDAAAANKIVLQEVGNNSRTTYSRYESQYIASLNQGWRVAPTNVSDNHDLSWGDGSPHRVGILAPALTKANVLDALRARRVFASEDRNLALALQANGAWMGGTIASQPTITFTVSVSDPDPEPIQLFLYDNGAVVRSQSFASSTITWNVAVAGNPSHYYFVRAKQTDGDLAYTAPIWTNAASALAPADSRRGSRGALALPAQSSDQPLPSGAVGGIYQTVAVVRDATYTFSLHGTMRALPGDPDANKGNYLVQWGIDPDAGDDWTRVGNWITLPWDSQFPRLAPGPMLHYATTFTAPSDKITFFIRVWKRTDDVARELDVDLDGISLFGPVPEDQAPPSADFGAPTFPIATRSYRVSASAADDVGVTELSLFDDDALVATRRFSVGLLNLESDFVWTPASPGKHTLRLAARDASGKATDTRQEVVVGALSEFLKNGDFENGFAPNGVALNWGGFNNGGSQAGYAYVDETWQPAVQSGQHAQLLIVNSRPFAASEPDRYSGICQSISGMTPGAQYWLTLNGLIRLSEGARLKDDWAYVVQWGYLPRASADCSGWTSVTNWQTLPWTTYHYSLSPGAYSSWLVPFYAPSTDLTLFVRVWKKWGYGGLEVFTDFDGLSLQGYR